MQEDNAAAVLKIIQEMASCSFAAYREVPVQLPAASRALDYRFAEPNARSSRPERMAL